MAYSGISKPSLHFNTLLYSGNGSSQSITGVGFQPDFIWNKARNQAYNHRSFDVLVGENKSLLPNGSFDVQPNEGVTFDSDGFSFDRAWGGDTNQSGATYCAWNWKAANSSGSSNTDGDITSTVSANTTAGFSIVKWSGVDRTGTIGHGLGAVPKMIIAKRLASRDWAVYHASVGANKKLVLNTTAAEASSTGFDATPTSSVINVGYNDDVNGGGADYIAYCFAEKKGYSKFGSYVGNGQTDGVFVYTGFKPAFIMCKRASSGTQNWCIMDNKRGYNPDVQQLHSNTTGVETVGSGDTLDLLSNGFKMRTNDSDKNGAATFIYMAFAEEPLVANVGASIPATAR